MSTSSNDKLARRRNAVELIAGLGLLIVAIALVVPVFNLLDTASLVWCKWVYAAGAFIFTVARCVPAAGKDASMRMRRLYRMEVWAGFALIIAAACWFYNEDHLGLYAGVLAILRPTVVLSLAGAVIQIVASVLISRQTAREQLSANP